MIAEIMRKVNKTEKSNLRLYDSSTNLNIQGVSRRRNAMLAWAFIFLVIAIIAAIVGYTGVFIVAAGIAKIIFFIFIILTIIAFISLLFHKQR